MTLKEARQAAGMTQVQLSSESNVGLGTIQRIENGKLEVASVGTLLKLCKALGCDISIFFSNHD